MTPPGDAGVGGGGGEERRCGWRATLPRVTGNWFVSPSALSQPLSNCRTKSLVREAGRHRGRYGIGAHRVLAGRRA